MRNFLARFIPFVFLGIAIVAFAFGFLLLMYLFIFGALVGLVLFTFSWIKAKFFRSKQMVRTQKQPPKQGRTIDHDV
jgi:hypothetical protein